MWKVLFRARDRFDRDQRGNVAILFAFSAVPLIGLLGGAVDMTRHQRYKTEILNAMDATAIALVRADPANDKAADAFVNARIPTMLPNGGKDRMLHLGSFDATKIDGGYRVATTATAYMDTAFMQVVGIRKMPFDLSTEVAMTGGKYEIALALDNTGSMRSFGRIEALRDAATGLVDDLYSKDSASNRVKMALVPFVTGVNIKSTSDFDMSWIDPVGTASYFHNNFSDANADRLQLFDKMHVNWAGCVEARAEHDEDDTAPDTAGTKWVPWLWPDEPDSGYGNSYLSDSGTGSDANRLRDVVKYTVPAGSVTDTYMKGPNAACPRPIVPLTSDTDLMKKEIGLMKPYNGLGANNSGTNIAQGLAWAWRVLSPGAPFEEGVPYSDTTVKKVLVLLSDGRNQVVANGDITGSDYTSYGYLADGRMGSTNNYLTAEQNVDQKVSRVCEAVKAQGIRVYTILLQVDFAKTQDLFRNCASIDEKTGKPLYYYIPDAPDLPTAFQDIGKDLATLRVTR